VALEHKGVPFEARTIPLLADHDRAERRRVSPTGRVPVLHHGAVVVPDSLAIIEYLDEVFPAPGHPPMWPADRAERAHARWLAATMHSGFAALRESMSFNLCFLPKRPEPSAAALRDAAEMLGLLEGALAAKTRPGPYLFGEFGAADVMYATAAWRLVAFDVPTRDTPRAGAYLHAVLGHPAVKAWLDAAKALPPVERE
jgi:glutathione S-transferase